jgi:hypothetical protein
MLRNLRQKGAKRLVLAGLGVVLVMTGALALSGGRPAYRNYKGQWVFAPVAIVIGLGGLFLAFRAPRPRSSKRTRARR